MSKATYDCIDKYVVNATCKGPLHVGGSSGDNFDILIRPSDGEPFIQASGISGAIRAYCMKVADKKTVNELFGDKKEMKESRVKFTDGVFILRESGKSEEKKEAEGLKEDVSIELRPHIKIDPETGIVADAKVKGADKAKSGQKFEMQYVASGSEFSFEIYLYGRDDTEEEAEENQKEKVLLEKALAALDAGEIQLGGKKSNGCGYLSNVMVKHKHYDMKSEDDRKKWVEETGMEDMKLPELQPEDYINAYEITISASTEGELLVKSIAPEDPQKEDASNIRNGEGQYIIPGSSIKGAIRNRMQMISDYMNLEPSLIIDAFGKQPENDDKGNAIEGQIGNLIFEDIVVGNGKETNLRTRIKIDKFTGGVQNQALFKELNIFGSMEINIRVSNKNDPEAVVGLLMLAIRDLKYKLFALGSEQSVGNGYLNIDKVMITDRKSGNTCRFDKDFAMTDEKGIMKKCMDELKAKNAA